MGSVTDRSAIEAVVTKWERWAAGEMFLHEHLHPRAKSALIVSLAEALSPPKCEVVTEATLARKGRSKRNA